MSPRKAPSTPPKPKRSREPRKVKGGSPKQAKTEARRDALHAHIRKHGLATLDVQAFAKQHGVAPKTVYEDLKVIAGQVGERGASVIVLAALERLRRADEEYLRILEESKTETRWITKRDGTEVEVPSITDSVRLGAANALAQNAKSEIEAMQRLGLLKGNAAELGSDENPVQFRIIMPEDA